jgi:hypothetical protein
MRARLGCLVAGEARREGPACGSLAGAGRGGPGGRGGRGLGTEGLGTEGLGTEGAVGAAPGAVPVTGGTVPVTGGAGPVAGGAAGAARTRGLLWPPRSLLAEDTIRPSPSPFQRAIHFPGRVTPR